MHLYTIGRLLCLLLWLHLAYAHVQVVNPKAGSVDEAKNAFRDNAYIRDREHMWEHLEGQVDKESYNPTDQEVDFYYFKSHDKDGNNQLDGIELYNAMEHSVLEEILRIQYNPEIEDNYKDFEIKSLYNSIVFGIDKILNEDDTNHDGYISFPEFMQGRNFENFE